MTSPHFRTIVVYVEDKPGVLNRVASLFRRRGYNIESLNVGRTHEEGISRMTIVVEADEDMGKRIAANLYKMVNVLKVDDITEESSIVRDLALIKVAVEPHQRSEVLQIADVFRARAVDMGPKTIILELTGPAEKITGLVQVLQPFGVLEMVQSGAIAMTRGPKRPGVPQLLANRLGGHAA